MYYDSFLRALMVEIGQRLGRRMETKIILDYVAKNSGSVLEIGSNLGYLTGRIADLDLLVIGIDTNPSDAVFNFARRRNSMRRTFFKRANGLETSFPDDHFDCVVLSHVLEHFADPKPLLDEIKRVLKKKGKGKLITVVPKEKYLGQNTPDHKLLFKSAGDLLTLLRNHNFHLLEHREIRKSIIAVHSIW